MASVTESVTEATEKAAEKLKESNIAQGVKESLVGSEQDGQPSAQIRSEFSKHAIKDEETGEEYMGETEFVNAIAPIDEDYVSLSFSFYWAQYHLHRHVCLQEW